MKTKVLLDSSFTAALNNPKDEHHQAAVHYLTTNSQVLLLMPEITLPEVGFLLKRAGGSLAVLRFMDRLVTTNTVLQSVTLADIRRAREIKAAYPKADFDIVDCCLMALSERLNIRHVCTYDRRDFAIFRPAHCPYLELLP
jgi:hypothetical protein